MFYFEHKAEVTAHTVKKVRCEECGYRYAYNLERTGVGTGADFFFGIREKCAEADAERDATRSVKSQLRSSVDVVPCPECGWVQEHMLPRARYMHLMWMWKYPWYVPSGCLVAMIAFLLLGAFANKAIRAPQAGNVLGSLAILFGGLMVLSGIATAVLGVVKYVLSQGYDPNKLPVGERIERGKELAWTPTEYDRTFRPRKPPPEDAGPKLTVDDFGM